MKKAIFFGMFACITCNSLQAQSSKAFKWVAWKDVTTKTKTELKKVTNYGDKTAYDDIIETIVEKCTVEVAVLDMDGDGKMEYAVSSEGSFCCGSHGCTLIVYKNGGKSQIHLTDEWREVRPAKNGILSSKGILIKFKAVKS